MELTEQQRRKIIRLAKLGKAGNVAVTEHLFELEEKIDQNSTEIKEFVTDLKKSIPRVDDILKSVKGNDGEKGEQGESGIQGERGDQGMPGESGKNGLDGKNGIDGHDGKNGKDGRDGRDGVDGRDGKDGRDGSPESPDEIRNKLELLQGDERLDKSAIKGLEDIERIAKNNQTAVPATTTFFSKNGQVVGRAKNINFIEGTNSTLSVSVVGDTANVTITASGGGLTPLTATGTIDDTNKVFTFTSAPTFLVINGGFYQKTGGAITWSGTTSVTLSQVVGTGGTIFGF